MAPRTRLPQVRCSSIPRPGRPRKFAYAPSLVVVDGGPPQVAAAQQALAELGITDIPVCGLAKRLEEVWLPGEEDPVIMARTSEGLYLLQRIRDEAHRFAITHHRGRRSKSMVESMLDDVPGPRRGAPQDAAQALRLAQEAARGRAPTPSRSCPASARARPTAIKEAVAKADATRKTASQPAGQHGHRRAHRGGLRHGRADTRRAGDRHRHDRRRSQHGRQGAGGPRLLRGRQPPADAGARRRAPRRRQPRHRPADRGRGRRTVGLVLRLAPGQPPPAGHRPPDDAALPRGHRRRPRPPPGGRPPAAPAPGQRPPAPRPPARARA